MLGLILAAAGMAISAIGGARSAKSTKEIAYANADLIRWEGEINLIRHRKEARALVGSQVSGYAHGGVLTTDGTAADVIRDTAIQSEHDALAMKYGTEQRVRITRKGGQASAQNITYNTVGNLFSGASTLVK